MPSRPVRCLTCGWEGRRKTDLPDNDAHPKPCPEGHEVLVGSWLPTDLEVTPTGIEIAYWGERSIETGAEQRRRYLVNDEKYRSVTELLALLDKQGVKFWIANLAREGKDWQEELKLAGKRGTAAHEMALSLLLGEVPSLNTLDPEHRPYGQAISKWVLDRQPHVIEAERMVASVEHSYAGRFDLLAKFATGTPFRVDFKSIRDWSYEGNGKRRPPYAENVLQIDLYERAARECGYDAANFGLVVRLGPDGTYDEWPFLIDVDRPLARFTDLREMLSDARKALRKGVPEGVLDPELPAVAA